MCFNSGVDVALWGHEHIYERLWPVYDYKVMNGTHGNPYYNTLTPVHIITGAAVRSGVLVMMTVVLGTFLLSVRDVGRGGMCSWTTSLTGLPSLLATMATPR